MIVNPVNTVGVMGAGLALQFANKYPEMLNEYKLKCKDGTIGKGYLTKARGQLIWQFPTKTHWINDSDYKQIINNMEFFAEKVNESKFTGSIAFPRLGCGLGGLDWKSVKQIILENFDESRIYINR